VTKRLTLASYCPQLAAVTPPGYKTVNGTTTTCADGEYRAEWKPPTAATSCTACGDGISSSVNDQVTQYDIATGAASSVDIRSSATACCEYPYVTQLAG
jgi:hypothetical protein